MTQTPWSDTPPSDLQPGEYIWFRFRGGEPYPVVYSGEIGDSDEFGPRVLSAEDTVKLTAEVERLRAENAALRALIENNNAVAEMCGLDLPKSL